MKRIIVINGKGGVGKDTLCAFANEKYRTLNRSSIDPIKEMASVVGWNGDKSFKSRKFLSDLKRIVTEYNDYPLSYIISECNDFINSDYELLFLHIRECEQIRQLVSSLDFPIITLLVRRGTNIKYGNSSDDNVELYKYDYIYENSLPLDEAEDDFLLFLEKMIDSTRKA